MDLQKAKEVMVLYHSALSGVGKWGEPPDRYPEDFQALIHANAMLDKMDDFLDDVFVDTDGFVIGGGEWDKFNRWLGFVQAIFWLNGLYSLEDLQEHIRCER